MLPRSTNSAEPINNSDTSKKKNKDKSNNKSKSVKSSASSHTSTKTHSKSASTTSSKEHKSNDAVLSKHLINVDTIALGLSTTARILLTQNELQIEMAKSLPNAEVQLTTYIKLAHSLEECLDVSSNVIKKKYQEPGVNFANLEVKTLEMFQEIKLWAQENKSDAFTRSVIEFANNDISAVQGKLRFFESLAKAHADYANVLYLSQTAHECLGLLENFMSPPNSSPKTLKELGTTDFDTFSKVLYKSNLCMLAVKEKYQALQDQQYNIKSIHANINNLKNALSLAQGKLQSPQDVSTYQSAFDIIKVSHRFLFTLIQTAELLCNDILEHPHYDLDNSIKVLEQKLTGPNNKLVSINRIHANEKFGLNATGNVSVKENTPSPVQNKPTPIVTQKPQPAVFNPFNMYQPANPFQTNSDISFASQQPISVPSQGYGRK